MERTRNPIDDIRAFALIANAPLAAHALLMANALGAQPLTAAQPEDFDPTEDTPAAESQAPTRRLLDRLDHWFWTLDQRALEARLAQATDIYDLEVRIREIERGTPWWSH